MRPRTVRACLWFLGFGTLVCAAVQSISWVTAESAVREQLRYEYDSPVYRALTAELRGQAEWRAILSAVYGVVLCGFALAIRADLPSDSPANG